jgi:hypothetical protein
MNKNKAFPPQSLRRLRKRVKVMDRKLLFALRARKAVSGLLRGANMWELWGNEGRKSRQKCCPASRRVPGVPGTRREAGHRPFPHEMTEALPSQSLRRLRKRVQVQCHNHGKGPGRQAHRPSLRLVGRPRSGVEGPPGRPAARDPGI